MSQGALRAPRFARLRTWVNQMGEALPMFSWDAPARDIGAAFADRINPGTQTREPGAPLKFRVSREICGFAWFSRKP